MQIHNRLIIQCLRDPSQSSVTLHAVRLPPNSVVIAPTAAIQMQVSLNALSFHLKDVIVMLTIAGKGISIEKF